jgi:hypothetical protein
MKFDFESYETLMRALLEGRTPVSYREIGNAPTCSRFLLRHDIDRGLEFLGRLPEIENSLGISATYFIQLSSDFYNPFSPLQAAMAERLLNMGHRLGLHFDCEKGAPDQGGSLDEAIEFEAAILERRFGPLDAVSFHQPGRDIIENKVKISRINTYDKADMAGFEYFSDSAQRWSKGDPVDYLRANPGRAFQVLLHPELWNDVETSFEDLAAGAVLSKAKRLYEYDLAYARGIKTPFEEAMKRRLGI